MQNQTYLRLLQNILEFFIGINHNESRFKTRFPFFFVSKPVLCKALAFLNVFT